MNDDKSLLFSVSYILIESTIHLVTFYSAVDVLNKGKTDTESSTTQHEEHCKGNNRHVPKVKGSLKKSTHPTGAKVEIKGICIQEETNHTTICER